MSLQYPLLELSLGGRSGNGVIPARRRRDWEAKELFYIVSYRSHNKHEYIYQNDSNYESYNSQ